MNLCDTNKVDPVIIYNNHGMGLRPWLRWWRQSVQPGQRLPEPALWRVG